VILDVEPEAQGKSPWQQAQQQYFSKLIILVIIGNPEKNVKRKYQEL
jgi:hypothetical protein